MVQQTDKDSSSNRTKPNRLLSALKRWWRFNRLYLGRPPWDSGISPPELKAVIEGERALPPGKALDLGCGTGTNVIYLAQHGWQATGVDYIPRAIAQARRKAASEGVTAHFYRGSVTRMPMLKEPFDLLLDMGCFHGLDPVARQQYAAEVIRLSHPGTLYLLYGFTPRLNAGNTIGVSKEEVETIFGPAFRLEDYQAGEDKGSERGSAWYTLRRQET